MGRFNFSLTTDTVRGESMTNICAHITHVKYEETQTLPRKYSTTQRLRRFIFTMVKMYYISFVKPCDNFRVDPK